MITAIINCVFVLCLIGLFAWYYNACMKKLSAYRDSISNLLNNLKQINPEEYSYRYQDIHNMLQENEYTSSCWNEYSKTLIAKQGEFNTELYSTEAASDYFVFSRLTCGIDIAFWQNLGGIFTGVGIFGTFLGLTYGLSTANLTSDKVEELKQGIAVLLSGVSTAFMTSLCGVAFALLFNFIHKSNINGAREKTTELVNFIEHMYPRKTSEAWLMDIMNQNMQQTNAIKNFSSDLVPALAKVFNQQMDSSFDKFIKSLEPLFEDLREGIEKMGEGGAKAVGDTISNGIGTELNGFAKTLSEIQSSLTEGMRKSQEEAAATNKKFTELAENFADKITESSTSAVLAQNKMMTDSIVKIEGIMQELQVSSKEASENFKEAINTSAEKQRDSLNETCEQIKTVLGEVNDNIKKAAENMVEANAVATAALAKSVETMGEKGKGLAELYTNHAKDQAGILGNASQEFKQSLEVAVEKMQAMLDNHDKVMKQTYEQYQDEFKAALEVINETRGAAKEIGASVEPVKDATVALTIQMANTTKAASDFNKVIGSETERMLAVSTLNEQNLKKLIASLDKTRSEWESYETHFRGISGEMDRSFRNLISGTQQYNEAVSSGLEEAIRKYDKHIAEILSKIAAQVESVEEATEELNDYLYRVKRNR